MYKLCEPWYWLEEGWSGRWQAWEKGSLWLDIVDNQVKPEAENTTLTHHLRCLILMNSTDPQSGYNKFNYLGNLKPHAWLWTLVITLLLCILFIILYFGILFSRTVMVRPMLCASIVHYTLQNSSHTLRNYLFNILKG